MVENSINNFFTFSTIIIFLLFQKNFCLEITLGISVSPNIAGYSSRDGLYFYVNWFNTKVPVVNRTIEIDGKLELITFTAHIEYDDGTLNDVLEKYKTLLSISNPILLFGPPNDIYSIDVIKLVGKAGRPLMSNIASYTSYSDYNGGFSASPSTISYVKGFLNLLRNYRPSDKIYVMHSSESPADYELCDTFSHLVKVLNKQLAGLSKLKIGAKPMHNSSLKKLLRPVAIQIRESAPDILIACFPHKYSVKIMEEFHELNYVPPLIVMTGLNSYDFANMSQKTLDYIDFVIYPSSFSRDYQSISQPYIGTSKDFYDDFNSIYNYPPTKYSASTVLGGMIYFESIKAAKSFDYSKIIQMMTLTYLESFMGISRFSAQSWQEIGILIYQRQFNSNVIIGEPFSNIKIRRVPTWKERENFYFTLTSSTIVSIGIASFGILISLCWIIFIFSFRKNPFIKASSPLFLYLLFIGTILVYLSAFTWFPYLTNKLICTLRIWILPAGAIFMISALVSKTYRVYLLYSRPGLEVFRVPDYKIFLMFIIIVSVQMGLCTWLSFYIGIESYLIDDIENFPLPSKIRFTCTLNGKTYIVVISALYIASIIIMGWIMAFKLRNIPFKTYDESEPLGISLYNIFFFSFVTFILHIVWTSQEITFLVTYYGCFIAAMSTTLILMIPKVYYIIKDEAPQEQDPRQQTDFRMNKIREEINESSN